jgi:hypothetical protein
MSLFETKTANPEYKKAHYIYFYNDKSKREAQWDLMRYLAVKSFHQHNPDYSINFYTNAQPTGEYWEKVSSFVNLHIVEPPTEVFGNPLVHPAHTSDVFRIKLLMEQGGVYSDFDTITIKSFDDLIAEEKFIVGKLGSRDWKYGNGVLVSPPNSKYLEEWYAEYTWFRSKGKDKYWDEHSVKMHSTLVARESLQGHFKTLQWEAFYPYRYTESEKLYDKFLPELILPVSYSVHLYDTSVNHNKIEKWNEQRLREKPNTCSFSWIASKYIE